MSEVKLLKPEEAGLTDQIQIFEDGIRTTFGMKDYSFSKNNCDVKIGDCYIRGNLSHYDICYVGADVL